MSGIVGVFWRKSCDEHVALAAYEVLKREIGSSTDSQGLTEIRIRHCLLLKFDFGAYGSTGLVSDNGVVSAVCGHPYVAHLREGARISHLRYLAAAARGRRLSDFARSRGSFSFVYADEAEPRLMLAADCLGVRPLYYADDGNVVVISSTLVPFRGLPQSIVGRRDERATVETAVFGFPLADRTQWQAVRCVAPGCALTFASGTAERTQYWSMSRVPRAPAESQKQALEAILESFRDAVALRVAGESSVLAHLSGGMDSRSVVAILRSMGIEVNTLNIAAPDSQDLLYGRMIAEALGCNHTEVPAATDRVFDSVRLAQVDWHAKLEREGHWVERPNLVWSGDGGSVTLGHVYLTDGIVEAAESEDWDRAIDVLLAERWWTVPKRVLRKQRINEIVGYPRDGLIESLSEHSSSDSGRRLHMMLMATDQRRHLHPYFEHIYEHRCELQLPFFDRRLVEAVIGRPARPFLYHRFYNRWFELLPEAVMSVPWQVYLGHEPCPVASADRAELQHQWSQRSLSLMRRPERRRYLAKTAFSLLTGGFARTAVSAPRLSVAWAATALRVCDLTYALKFSSMLANR
jgi:asparagine synthase (glutamine-hydrolysing)